MKKNVQIDRFLPLPKAMTTEEKISNLEKELQELAPLNPDDTVCIYDKPVRVQTRRNEIIDGLRNLKETV